MLETNPKVDLSRMTNADAPWGDWATPGGDPGSRFWKEKHSTLAQE
jgi:hypothetical protein